MMKISMFGLGYVGVISSACLAKQGHDVIGVDPVDAKVDMINQGHSPIVEKDADELINSAVASGLLKAVKDPATAVAQTDISLVCVGTPSLANGDLDLSYIRRVCEQIGTAIKSKNNYHTVAIRSTMLPGSVRSTVIPALETCSGKKAGKDFGVCINPEFLREGSAVYDYYHPPKIVIGQLDEHSGDAIAQLYEHLDAPLIRTTLETAEMVKYADNAWHALKITFANEIGRFCKALDIDSHKVMDIFTQDMKLNISTKYLKPGFAFGGSCLPKDLRALNYKARVLDQDLPVLNAILPSNKEHVERGINMVMAQESKKVGILGFSFKAGTDDLRESPIVEVIERLLGKGYDLRIYDRNVNLAKLIGANRDYILNAIPHISNIMVDSIDEIMAHADVVVIGSDDPEFKNIPDIAREGQTVVDLVRIAHDFNENENYHGLCW